MFCSDNQKLKNALIPLFLSNLTKCQKHIKALKVQFKNTNNVLFKEIIRNSDKTSLNFLFQRDDGSFRINLQYLFDVIDDPTVKINGNHIIHFAVSLMKPNS